MMNNILARKGAYDYNHFRLLKQINFTNPRMHLFHNPHCSIQNRDVHISVLIETLWDMERVHSGICDLGQLYL